MRRDVMDRPLSWAPNALGAISIFGLALPAFAGFLVWWNAPGGTKRIDGYSAPVQRLFTAGECLTGLGLGGVIVTDARSLLG